ncbi:MAG: uncharacterized protein JWN34_5577 [Bryobacterales bacterium]|nr:uncharacterized protein [Bryobacterales bacterium]
MRLLLDECVDERFRHVFDGHDCETARYARMAGLKNGALLAAAESAGFDVLITADQHIPDQQSFQGRKLALLVLVARRRLRSRFLCVASGWTG